MRDCVSVKVSTTTVGSFGWLLYGCGFERSAETPAKDPEATKLEQEVSNHRGSNRQQGAGIVEGRWDARGH